MCRYGTTWFFTFQDEERQLDFGPAKQTGDDDDEEAPRQPKLRAVKDAPPPDPAAGDVLEAQRVITTLAEFKVVITEAKYFAYSDDQRAQLVEWAANVRALNEQPDITADRLPQPPPFLFDKKRTVTKPLVEAVTAAADKTARKPRAPRRSSAQFTNTPKLAGTVKKAKGAKRRQAVN